MKSVNIKHQIFENKEHYLAFRAAWKTHFHTVRYSDAVHNLLYAILRDRDLTKVFHTEERMYEILGQLMVQLKYGQVKFLGYPFGDTLTKEMLLKLHDLILGREKAA